jgi:hypothetical protein
VCKLECAVLGDKPIARICARHTIIIISALGLYNQQSMHMHSPCWSQ